MTALALPAFPRNERWEAELESLAFTAEALFAHPEPDDQFLGGLAQRILGVLTDWERIDADGRSLRRDAIHAEARVRQADAELDRGLDRLARVLVTADGGRPGPLYERFFPEPHPAIIELGLDASLPVAMAVTMAMSTDESLPPQCLELRGALTAAVQLANRALSERSEAYASLGRHRARVQGWLETAVGVRRNTARALLESAQGRGLPRRFPATFFLEPLSEILGPGPTER